jgi:hypothetical protein
MISPIRMRLCLPEESGGVMSKHSPLSDHEGYDWAIVPFEEYLHGQIFALFRQASDAVGRQTSGR